MGQSYTVSLEKGGLSYTWKRCKKGAIRAAHPYHVIYRELPRLYMQPLLTPQATEFVICICIFIRLQAVTLLPTPRSLVTRRGLGNTWVMQLRSGSLPLLTAATKCCNVSLLANKPYRWKSMLTHQGWFNLIIYATFTTTTSYRVCNWHIYFYPTPSRHTNALDVSDC